MLYRLVKKLDSVFEFAQANAISQEIKQNKSMASN